MSELEAFIVRGHEKIIAHYRWLRDTARTAEERARFERCMAEEERLLLAFAAQRSIEVLQAA